MIATCFLLIIWFVVEAFANSSSLLFGENHQQIYSFLRIYQFKDYSSVKFLQFHLDGPTSIAEWSLFFLADEKCRERQVNYHFHLQNEAYPLFNLYNESFPDNYISSRHDLIFSKLNQTFPNGTIRIENPRLGTWFGATFVEDPLNIEKNKIVSNSLQSCSFTLTTKLNYQIKSFPLQIVFNRSLPIIFLNSTSTIEISYFSTIPNAHLNALLNFNTQCTLTILSRINGLPDRSQFDFRFVCPNAVCIIDLGQYAASIWIYFQILIDPISCSSIPIEGTMLIQSIDTFISSENLQFDSMQRSMSNNIYDFVYLPMSTMNSSIPIEFNEKNRSIYIYEFFVDDRNLGGTIHIDFQSETRVNVQNLSSLPNNTNIRVCLSKFRPEIFEKCEENFRIILTGNVSVSRSLPYPEMAPWYITLKFYCNNSNNQCENTSILLRTRLTSSACTRDSCGTYGICRVLTSQQNLYSTCSCIAGFRGYGCTDDSQSFLSKFLPSVLFLTLSNLLFIPAIIMSIYYRLYIEALIYFFNMFFSTFYHACDQDLFNFCIFKYDGLQLADFISSYSSFVITLMSMSLIRRSLKTFLFMFGVLACIAINVRDRFGSIQFIILISLTFAFTLTTWIFKSIKIRQIQPSRKILLVFIPGFALSITGLLLFVFVETDENYWYIHSLWHIFMSTSILFFLPHQKKVKTEISATPSNSFVNPLAIGPLNDSSENSHL